MDDKVTYQMALVQRDKYTRLLEERLTSEHEGFEDNEETLVRQNAGVSFVNRTRVAGAAEDVLVDVAARIGYRDSELTDEVDALPTSSTDPLSLVKVTDLVRSYAVSDPGVPEDIQVRAALLPETDWVVVGFPYGS